ncbi:DNA adenine methylase, partial [Caproiciproducens galactitolivorans]|uniref:DNA adenine methylase n=1 Tax=Caproiciproducens galactitolivorans TaxID=642589 RepID=UPI002408F685
MNSIISWVGGKKALRDMIYQRMPKEFGRYIEVFGGGGWVLFGRPPDAAMEVYNDFNSDLANLFRCVRDRPFALLKELNFFPLNGRDEFNVLKKYLEKEEFTNEYLQEELDIAQRVLSEPQYEEIRPILIENAQMNDVKRAAAFYRLIRLSYGSGCTSYGCQPFDIRKTFHLLWQGSRRLKDTIIENKDFEALICQYDRDNAFFYCDPPYF